MLKNFLNIFYFVRKTAKTNSKYLLKTFSEQNKFVWDLCVTLRYKKKIKQKNGKQIVFLCSISCKFAILLETLYISMCISVINASDLINSNYGENLGIIFCMGTKGTISSANLFKFNNILWICFRIKCTLYNYINHFRFNMK